MSAPENRPHILAVVGPTASGKTALSVRLAKRLGGEILSCDSMQVYRGMDIGTAKPTEAEREGVVHHLIDIADPCRAFSAADYVASAQNAIGEVISREKLPIVAGGTGLYLDALLRGGFDETESDPARRATLFAYAEQYGAHALHERLRAIDPESADAIHENNIKRVVRALEICEGSGMTKTESDRRTREGEAPYRATVVGLWYPDRAVLYDRIARRVREMLDVGLVEETKRLLDAGVFSCNGTAAQAIGYKEILPHLRGEEELAAAAERLTVATRHYAKRQLTWFRAKEYVHWISMTQADGSMRDLDDLTDEIVAYFEQNK